MVLAFNLNSLKMGLGDENDQNNQPPGGYDVVKVTGTKSANCVYSCDTVTAYLHVTDTWQTFNLAGFTGLSNVTVYQQVYYVNGVATITPERPEEIDAVAVVAVTSAAPATGDPAPAPSLAATLVLVPNLTHLYQRFRF